MVHLAATKQTYRAKDIAEVMFHLVYKLHGMPSNIVSDHNTLFTSTFWQHLNQLTGVELQMSMLFHPQTDGATERANWTITQMLRSQVSPHQKDWASKLLAIEFAINSASSSTTGYIPFVLNYGQLPPPLIWNMSSKFPGMQSFLQMMKDTTMAAHNAVISARVKSTTMANRKRIEAPFIEGDLVYLLTVNLSLPKGQARKLSPKYIGPYRILRDYHNNLSLLDLPAKLKQRGLHPAFHAHLLRLHVPNNNRHFPGRQLQQILDIGVSEEWSVSRVSDHHGQGTDALFKVEYTTGDHVWLPYHDVARLEAVGQYLESLGAPSIKHLPKKVFPGAANIVFTTIGTYSEAHNIVLSLVDLLLENLAKSSRSSTYLSLGGNSSSPSLPATIPSSMLSHQVEPPLADAMNIDTPVPTKIRGSYTPQSHSGRGRHSSRRHDWYKGQGGPYQHKAQMQNADAMSAFTSFFRAEAEASKPSLTLCQQTFTDRWVPPRKEELATRKEAHASNQQVWAEHHSEFSQYHQCSHHLTLDNRHVPHSSDRSREPRAQRAGSRPIGGSASCTSNPFAN